MNSTQQGISPVAGKDLAVLGRHVIQVSSELDPVHLQRAIAHEVAEIFEIDRLNFAGEYGGPDALRPGARGNVLSPHDLGRIAELEVLLQQGERGELELQALIDHLGLREGAPGSTRRLDLVLKRLPEYAERLRELQREPAAGTPARERLDEVRRRAKTDERDEHVRARDRSAVGHAMPSLRGPDGKPLENQALAKRAHDASVAREHKSVATWNHLRDLASRHVGAGHAKLPYEVMVGGGVSLAARDRNQLLVDDCGRWQADGNHELAQTGNQVKPVVDAQLGDARLHAKPNERFPLDAIRAWEDEIAAQGPVVNGRASWRIGDRGKMLVDILSGTEKLTFEVDSVPVVATGFVPERIPGAPFKIRPADARDNLDEALRRAGESSKLSESEKAAIKRARQRLANTMIVNHRDTQKFLDILSDPELAVLKDNKAIEQALAYGHTVKHWEEVLANDDPDHPHVFLGDQANLGRAQALRSNNWVIAGMGGTGVSAAEIVLGANPRAHVTMVGDSSPAGLLENDQFRELALNHADKKLAAELGIGVPTSRRLSLQHDRVGEVKAMDRSAWESKRPKELVDESTLDPRNRSKSVFDVNGKNVHATGTAYVAALGRNDDYPPMIAQLMEQARVRGGDYFITPLFEDRQYAGYRVEIEVGDEFHKLDVTGAASRFLPIEDAKRHFKAPKGTDMKVEELDKISRLAEWDAPPESGLFAGGLAPTATQAARYARYRSHERKKP